MAEKFGGEQFLNEKYPKTSEENPGLANSAEVESASKRQEVRTGKKPKDKHEKVGAYLDRLNKIFNPEDAEKREVRVDFLKDKLHDKLVIKEIPESYFKQQQKIAREQGHGDIEITDQLREEALKTITVDQEQSLDQWIDYLGSSDATYPDWLKYYAFRSIVKLSQYDKEKKEFKERSKTTTAPFPDINREALAYVLDALEKQQKEKAEKKGKKEEVPAEPPTDEQWEKLLKTQNFGKLYAHAIEKIIPASEEEKENIQGEWIKYEQGSDAKPLYESLQGYGTGWCTAGESVAKAQLQAGDFYVFYTKDKQGLNKIPRVAIRMQEGEIAEVRGVQADQNLESVMTDVAKEKMSTLSGGEKYEKKVSDMKRLTEIESKVSGAEEVEREIYELTKEKIGDPRVNLFIDKEALTEEEIEEINKLKSKLGDEKVKLTKEELRFLYEIDNEIEGFGYGKDSRIDVILRRRDTKKDFAFIFNCMPEQIAFSRMDLNDNTVVFNSYFDGRKLESIPKNLKYILGEACFVNSEIKDLGRLQYVKGMADFDNSRITNLGQLQSIGGRAYFCWSDVKDLAQLKTVGGDLNLIHSRVENLGQLQSVGGNILINKESKLNFLNIKVGGRIVIYH